MNMSNRMIAVVQTPEEFRNKLVAYLDTKIANCETYCTRSKLQRDKTRWAERGLELKMFRDELARVMIMRSPPGEFYTGTYL